MDLNAIRDEIQSGPLADELGHAQGHTPTLADLSGFATY